MNILKKLILTLAIFVAPLTAHASDAETDLDFVTRASMDVIQDAARLIAYADSCTSTSPCSEENLARAEHRAAALRTEAGNLRDRLQVLNAQLGVRYVAYIYGTRLALRGTRQALDLVWGGGGGPVPFDQWCCGWPAGAQPGDSGSCNKWCCKWEWGDKGADCNSFICSGTKSDDCDYLSCSCQF